MSFEIPSLQTIIARVKSDFLVETGVNALRRSVEYALIRALAGQSRGQYGFLSWILRQAFADTAAETYFWRHAALRGIDQQAATPWVGEVTFTGTNTTNIPDGTVLSRSDGWLYETTEAGVISGGEVTLAVTAQSGYEGADGNNVAGDPLALATPMAGVDNECEVDSSTTDGTDVETQADGLTRYLQDVRNPTSDGGGTGDYVRWAREVAGVTRAWETSAEAGEVEIAFVRDNDGSGSAILPDSGERAAVLAYVQEQAPITVVVSVATLTANTVNFTLSVLPNTVAVQDAVEAELADFFAREAEPGGTLNLSRINEAISSAAGETSHVLASPAADVTSTSTQMPILGTVTFT